jgi:hypothetical protein
VTATADTINYEVFTSILPKVTRVYLKGERVVEAHSLADTDKPDPVNE